MTSHHHLCGRRQAICRDPHRRRPVGHRRSAWLDQEVHGAAGARPQLGGGVRAAVEVTLTSRPQARPALSSRFCDRSGAREWTGNAVSRYVNAYRSRQRKKHAEPGCHQHAAAFERAAAGRARHRRLCRPHRPARPHRRRRLEPRDRRAGGNLCAFQSGPLAGGAVRQDQGLSAGHAHRVGPAQFLPPGRVLVRLSRQRRSDHDREGLSRPDEERFQADPAGRGDRAARSWRTSTATTPSTCSSFRCR